MAPTFANLQLYNKATSLKQPGTYCDLYYAALPYNSQCLALPETQAVPSTCGLAWWTCCMAHIAGFYAGGQRSRVHHRSCPCLPDWWVGGGGGDRVRGRGQGRRCGLLTSSVWTWVSVIGSNSAVGGAFKILGGKWQSCIASKSLTDSYVALTWRVQGMWVPCSDRRTWGLSC